MEHRVNYPLYAATSHSTFDLLQFARYQGRYHLSILEGLALNPQ